MTRDPAAELLDEALRLPPEARAKLASRLLSSLDDDKEFPSEAEYEAAWAAELGRRAEELESGAVEPVPWSAVRERLAGK